MDTLLLIIVTIVLVETSVLVYQRRTSPRTARGFSYGQRSILVDTSVLIDGRILDIANAGFVPGRLVVPRSVLGELQLLADGADHEKRARARNGLEVITQLQAVSTVSLEIYPDQSEAREGVDNRLLALARELTYELCTVDYNLQKVAQAEGITILSINELSQKLRALYLPGEKIDLTLKQKGQDKGQAIGYASDGTMVVVDNADKFMDKTVAVEVIRSLQTNSGKMMFAKLVVEAKQPQSNDNSAPSRRGRVPRQAEQPIERTNKGNQPERVNKRILSRNRTHPESQTSDRQSNVPSPRLRQSPEDGLLDLVNKQ